MAMLKMLIGFLFGVFRKKQTDWSEFGDMDNDYEFNLQESKVVLSSSIPIRNYETILREKDTNVYCECGKKFKTKLVKFSITGSGKTKCLPVQYCPRCDDNPPESAILFCAINNQPFFCGA